MNPPRELEAMPSKELPESDQTPATSSANESSPRVPIRKYAVISGGLVGGALFWLGALVLGAPYFDNTGLWWFLTGVGNGVLVGWSLSLNPKERPQSYRLSGRVPLVGVLCGGSTAISIFAAAGTEIAEKWSWLSSSTVLAMITCYAPFPIAWNMGRASSQHRRIPRRNLQNAMDMKWLDHSVVMVLVWPIVFWEDTENFGLRGGIVAVFSVLNLITHMFSFSIIATELERDLNWDEPSIGRRSWFDETPSW